MSCFTGKILQETFQLAAGSVNWDKYPFAQKYCYMATVHPEGISFSISYPNIWNNMPLAKGFVINPDTWSWKKERYTDWYSVRVGLSQKGYSSEGTWRQMDWHDFDCVNGIMFGSTEDKLFALFVDAIVNAKLNGKTTELGKNGNARIGLVNDLPRVILETRIVDLHDFLNGLWSKHC